MPVDVLITIIVILLAIALLVSNRIRPDLVALMVLLTLGLTGVVEPARIFSGFGSSAVMTILGISMISVGLQQTGATNALGKFIYRVGGSREWLLILLVSLTSAALSLFMNNIAAVGVLLPAVISLSRRSKISPSRLLMPLAFGTILGGMATLLTTSNIIVSGALRDAGLPSFGLLDYFPIGAPVVVVGILYLVTLGRKLLPKRRDNSSPVGDLEFTDRLKDLYQLEKNLVRIKVLADSPFIGQTIQQAGWAKKLSVNILAILRNRTSIFAPNSGTTIHANDVIIARGKLVEDQIEKYNLCVEAVSESDLQVSDETHPLAEVVITPHSRLIGKNIKDVHFRDQYYMNVVGAWRDGKPVHSGFSDLSLRFGDALLVQGPASQIHKFQSDTDLVVLEEDPDAVLLPRKGLIAVLITLVTLTVAAIGIMPVAQVVLAGAVLLMLTGCMNMNDAFRSIEWKAIFLIAGMWPLSIALQQTGLAADLVNSMLNFIGTVQPIVIGAIFIAISMILTLLMSGQVSAIVMIPLALAAAQHLGLDPRPLAMGVALGCSLAFISPLGHPVNIMVMNPGGYTFKDFFRVGFPLTILAFAVILAGLRLIWGL